MKSTCNTLFSQVILSHSNLQNVIEAAAHLQFQEVLGFCAQFLRDRLTIDNCLHFLHMAETYELKGCEHDIKEFILGNFVTVAQNEAFKEISPDLLIELLSNDKLQAESELDVFQVGLTWLLADSERLTTAKQVLEHVRYGLMTPEEMEEVYGNALMLSEQCQPVLQEALNYHLRLFVQPIIDTPIARMRASVKSLVLLGAGKMDNSLCGKMLAAKLRKGRLTDFQALTPMKNKRYFASVAVLNNFVFVVGGQVAMAGDGSHATNTAFRYNPRDGKWLQISSMITSRTYFSLVTLPDGLLAIGGKHNRVSLRSVEKYNFKSNEWVCVASLPNTLFSHAGCMHMDKVYISGGCPGENFTDQVHCYDPARDGWQICSPMNQSRGYHVMVSHNDQILVCAGNTNAGSRADVLNIETYDVETNQWTILSEAGQGQSEAPAVQVNNQLYILGGYSWNMHSFLDLVQCYDLDKDKWETLDVRLPEPMTGGVACCLQLPTKLFDHHAVENG